MSRGIRPGRFMFFRVSTDVSTSTMGEQKKSPLGPCHLPFCSLKSSYVARKKHHPSGYPLKGGGTCYCYLGQAAQHWTRCGADFQMTGNSESINF